jgi:hypothetical protein
MSAPAIRYLAATSSSLIGHHANLGIMIGPRQGGVRPLQEGRVFGVDNDAFHGKFEPEAFAQHLGRLLPFAETCLFVAMPDFIDDPESTTALFRCYAPGFVERYPLPLALVAQTGAVPQDLVGADVLFLAGRDEWRMGPGGDDLILAAKEEYGIPVHVGRVNSERRLLHFAARGVESVDGTYLSYRGLDLGLEEIGGWLDAASDLADQPYLIPPAHPVNSALC